MEQIVNLQTLDLISGDLAEVYQTDLLTIMWNKNWLSQLDPLVTVGQTLIQISEDALNTMAGVQSSGVTGRRSISAQPILNQNEFQLEYAAIEYLR